MNGRIVRTFLAYLILGLVFLPALTLLVAKPRLAESSGDPVRSPIVREDPERGPGRGSSIEHACNRVTLMFGTTR